MWIFSIFFYVFENSIFDKNWGYNRATRSSVTREIVVCDM